MAGEKHTPGPWHVFKTTNGLSFIGIGETNGEGIADCGFGVWRGGDAEALANAHLIASAPELKEASIEQAILIEGAQAILTSYPIPDGIDADECVSRLIAHFDGPDERRVKALHVAAIAKAKGGEA